MKKSLLVIAILAILAVIVLFIFIQRGEPEQLNIINNEIEIKGFAFSPAELTIQIGDTVIWTNKDSAPHNIISDPGEELSSPTLQNGQSYEHTFNSVGVFGYYCSLHPLMKGKVTVE